MVAQKNTVNQWVLITVLERTTVQSVTRYYNMSLFVLYLRLMHNVTSPAAGTAEKTTGSYLTQYAMALLLYADTNEAFAASFREQIIASFKADIPAEPRISSV